MTKRWMGLVVVTLLVLLSACARGNTSEQATATAPASIANEHATAATVPTRPAPATNTLAPPTTTATVSPAPTATATAEPTPVEPTATVAAAEAEPAGDGAIIVNHETLAAFDALPDEAIAAASELRHLFRHASVGHNIDNGLNCLQNAFAQRPNYCDRGLAPDEIQYDSIYDRSNWTFEFHSPPPGQNPAWWNKVGFFIDRVNNLAPDEEYDVISFKLGYVDGLDNSGITEAFFAEEWPGLRTIGDIEALQEAHPDKQLVWWTMGLARIVGTANSAAFNEQLRAYVMQNGGVLMDIADIESHSPDGTLCTHEGYPALCPDYTEESRGGHLNARGSQRLARALWLAMALLAGWDGS
jgi:hypothetical protein